MKRTILLSTAIVLFSITAFAQRTIRGKVIDQQTNQPIAGASVVTSSDKGKPTDLTGAFEISTNADSITVSSIGYITQRVKLPGSGTVLVRLEATNTALNEVIVEGNGTQNKLLKTPSAIGVITNKDFSRTNGLMLFQPMNLLPGVKMEMRNITQGARIVLRGYGNETNFNGVGYKAYLNGIPLTDADGSTILDDVDFSNLGRVEVIKGPASSLYGNALSGVVLMQMQKAAPGENSVTQQVTGGQYGLFRTNTTYKSGTENASLVANYGHQTYQGFRMHGSGIKDFVNLNGDYYLGKRTISVFAGYSRGFDYLPGQVDSNNLYNHPDSSSLDYVANDAHVNFENVKLGISQDYKLSSHFSNTTSVFLVGSYLDQPSAAGLSRTLKAKFGGRSVFTWSPANTPLKFSAGGEFIKNKNFAKSYTLTNNVLGALRADQEISAQQYSVFAQAEAAVTKTTTITLGAGENFLEYAIADLRATTTTPAYVNQSVYKRFKPIFAPKITITQLVNENVSVYGTISKGFSAPATSQITMIPPAPANPVVNDSLKPEVATNYEIGSKGNLFGRKFNYDIALFSMDVKDKLITQYAAGNLYTITINAGKVRHQGAELSLSYTQTFEKGIISLVKPFLSYTYSNYKYVDFQTIPSDPKQQNPSNPKLPVDFSGKQVEGTPKNLFNAGIDFESHIGIYLNATYMYVDKMPVDFANLHYANAYSLLNGKLGYQKQVCSHFNLDVFAGLDNITDTHYATHVFLNSRDYPKIYNPMPLRNWYLGTSLKFIF